MRKLFFRACMDGEGACEGDSEQTRQCLTDVYGEVVCCQMAESGFCVTFPDLMNYFCLLSLMGKE